MAADVPSSDPLRRVVLFAGGDAPSAAVMERVGPVDDAVAADLGLDHAWAAGVTPRIVVGDFDSVSAEGLARARRAGLDVREFPVDKDATDLELALAAARELDPDELVVVGGGGGRLDHLLANLLLLADRRWAGVDVRAEQAGARIWVIRDDRVLDGAGIGALTLLPVGGDAVGVRTDGLRFPLRGETLPAGTTRGISNEFTANRARVSLTSGTLLAVGVVEGEA